MPAPRVLFVASECFPYVKTGGLADVVGSLPPALRAIGIDARLLLPGYPGVLGRLADAVPLAPTLRGLGAGVEGRLLRAMQEAAGSGAGFAGVPTYVLDAPDLFGREGNPYLGPDGRDWPDNTRRFAALCRLAARIGLEGVVEGGGDRDDGGVWVPDIIHGHDWQAGLVPAYLRRAGWAYAGMPRPATVTTIHNLAFQGLFGAEVLADLDLPGVDFGPDGLEYYGRIGFLKAGLVWSDRVTTVSPTYAREIQGPEMGFGLDGVLAARGDAPVGILNGIDALHWNPADDPHIAAPFDADSLFRRAANKSALQREFGLEERADALLVGVVSRLTDQKGIDLIVAALPRLLSLNGQLAVLGTGSAELEQALAAEAARHPGRVALRLAYDEGLSHRIQAGADMLAVPSRFEPCGLTQMYALRYGTLPLVAGVGGLADTVTDVTEASLARGSATGFVFTPVGLAGLLAALDRAAALFRHKALWRGVQRNAMARDLGWDHAARDYAALYAEVAAGRGPSRIS